MKIKILLLFVLINYCFAQHATLIFNNKTYANDTLFLLIERDFISKIIDTISIVKLDKDGKGTTTIFCKEPFFVAVPLYKYRIWFCVEPNQTYTLFIPNKTLLSIEDSLNAYFKPLDFYAPTIPYDTNITQNAIIELNNTIDSILEKHLKNIKYNIKRKFVDSLINKIQSKFAYVKSNYFRNYLYYKIAWIKNLSYERDKNFIIKNYFSTNPILLNNLAYTELFDEIFVDYLSYYSLTKWGENVYANIARSKSPTELRKDLRKNPAILNDTLADLIILKGLHDAYFLKYLPNKVNFPTKQLIMTIDSMTIVAKTPELRQIAKNILRKIREKEQIDHLLENIPLYNSEGTEYYLRNFAGKYLYVSIMDFRAYNFLTEQKKIKATCSRFSNKLRVINIVLNANKANLEQIIKKEELYGEFLYPANSEKFKKQLRISALPVFFIFSPTGKIINANAPPPDENIISYFNNIIK
jgi:hypothetical protein